MATDAEGENQLRALQHAEVPAALETSTFGGFPRGQGFRFPVSSRGGAPRKRRPSRSRLHERTIQDVVDGIPGLERIREDIHIAIGAVAVGLSNGEGLVVAESVFDQPRPPDSSPLALTSLPRAGGLLLPSSAIKYPTLLTLWHELGYRSRNMLFCVSIWRSGRLPSANSSSFLASQSVFIFKNNHLF